MDQGDRNAMRYQIEFVIFCLFLACVPHFLAPENILYGVFALVWVINRGIDKNWGGSWRCFDSVILIFMLLDLVVNGVNWLHGRGFEGGLDLLRYSSVLWMVSRTEYSNKQIYVLFTVILLTTLMGVGYAYHQYLQDHHEIAGFYFKALGERNHTAIFMDLVMGMTGSFLLAFWKKWSWGLRIILIMALGVLSFAQLVDASRAAYGAAFGMGLILAVVYWWRLKAVTWILLGLLAIGSVLTFMMHPVVLQRQEVWQQQLEQTGKEPRECIWHAAWLTFEQSPWIGFGSHRYGKVATPTNIQQWADVKYKNQPISSRPCFDFAPHAHDVYLTTLAEMGVVGFAGLLLMFASWLVVLIKNHPFSNPEKSDLYWALWSSASCAWFVNIGIGLVNTTLHHEHALLSMALLGLALSYFYQGKKNA